MSTKWNTQNLGQGQGNPSQGAGKTDFDALFKDEYVILFFQGKNSFGDLVYCYVKVMYPEMDAMNAALQSGNNYNPGDYGTVIAAGKGDPTDEVKAELAITYPMFDQMRAVNYATSPASPAPAPQEKKEWDEY